jgi:hypothetical protein
VSTVLVIEEGFCAVAAQCSQTQVELDYRMGRDLEKHVARWMELRDKLGRARTAAVTFPDISPHLAEIEARIDDFYWTTRTLLQKDHDPNVLCPCIQYDVTNTPKIANTPPTIETKRGEMPDRSISRGPRDRLLIDRWPVSLGTVTQAGWARAVHSRSNFVATLSSLTTSRASQEENSPKVRNPSNAGPCPHFRHWRVARRGRTTTAVKRSVGLLR